MADGAQLLANQRSARATAALSLVGRARWCVVEREGMATLENTSERMRVSRAGSSADLACLIMTARCVLCAVALLQSYAVQIVCSEGLGSVCEGARARAVVGAGRLFGSVGA